MSCLIHFIDSKSKQRYTVDASLESTLYDGFRTVISQNHLKDSDHYSVQTKSGRKLKFHETFKAQKVLPGAELVIYNKQDILIENLKSYGWIAALSVGLITVAIVAVTSIGGSPAENENGGTVTTVDSIITKPDTDTVTVKEPEKLIVNMTSELKKEKLQLEINMLTLPSKNYADRKALKSGIIYDYFVGPEAQVIEKFRDMPTAVTTIEEWLSDFIILDGAQISIEIEDKDKAGKIRSVLIKSD